MTLRGEICTIQMSSPIINALPFIVSNFGDPVLISNAGEYTAICNSDKTVFLFKSQILVDSIPNDTNRTVQNLVSTKISIRLYSSPIMIATNGSPQVVLYINNQFKVERIPIFTMAKFCTILSSSLFIVADQHAAYYWNMETNKCQLCFTSEKEIVFLEHSQGKTYVFTTGSFDIISGDNPVLSISFYCPPQCWIRHSTDLNSFFILNNNEITPLIIDKNQIVRKEIISLPNQPNDFVALGDSLIVLFSAKEGRKRVVRKYSLTTQLWSNVVDVPLITAMYSCGKFVLAACSQFTLVIHEFPVLFDKISAETPLIDLLLAKFDDADSFKVLTLFFGLDSLTSELSSHNATSRSLVELGLDELWQREMFDQWVLLALEYPKYLKSQHSSERIVELLKTRKFDANSNIQFAALLEASGDYWNAFLIYLRAKNVESVSAIMHRVIDHIEPHVNEVIDLCSFALKSNKRESASNMLQLLSSHPKIAKPEEIIPQLMFSWDLLDMYYNGFDMKTNPPSQEVVNSYLNGLAIYQPSKLRDFLVTNKIYDASRACDSLLKLGRLDEYGYVLRRTNNKKYIEFLIIREDWATLFKHLEHNIKEWPYVLSMMAFESSYFVEFVKHFDMLNISLSEMLAQIPKNCDPSLLADGFSFLAKIINSRNESEEIVEEICSSESFRLFDELVNNRSDGIVVDL